MSKGIWSSEAMNWYTDLGRIRGLQYRMPKEIIGKII